MNLIGFSSNGTTNKGHRNLPHALGTLTVVSVTMNTHANGVNLKDRLGNRVTIRQDRRNVMTAIASRVNNYNLTNVSPPMRRQITSKMHRIILRINGTVRHLTNTRPLLSKLRLDIRVNTQIGSVRNLYLLGKYRHLDRVNEHRQSRKRLGTRTLGANTVKVRRLKAPEIQTGTRRLIISISHSHVTLSGIMSILNIVSNLTTVKPYQR